MGRKYSLLWVAAAISFFLTGPAIGQVQIFERGAGGIIPFVGSIIHPKMIQWTAGAEYNIEARSSVGVQYSQPLQDTIFNEAEGPKSYYLNPYLNFEILEPDKAFPFSISLRLGYRYYESSEENAQGRLKQQATRNMFYGGPEFSGRFYLGDNGMLVPSAGYEFIYFRETVNPMRTINGQEVAGAGINEDGFLHDALLRIIYNHMFSERVGILLEPGATMRVGGDETIEVFGRFNLGLVIKIL